MKVRLQEAPENHSSFFKDDYRNNEVRTEELDNEPVEIAEGNETDIYGLCPNDFEYYESYEIEYIKRKYGEDFFAKYGNDIDFCFDMCDDNYGPSPYFYNELKEGLQSLLNTKNMWKYVDTSTTLDEAATIGYIVGFAEQSPGEDWFSTFAFQNGTPEELRSVIKYIDEHIIG